MPKGNPAGYLKKDFQKKVSKPGISQRILGPGSVPPGLGERVHNLMTTTPQKKMPRAKIYARRLGKMKNMKSTPGKSFSFGAPSYKRKMNRTVPRARNFQ